MFVGSPICQSSSMETLEEVWGADEVQLNNISRLIPEIPSCPTLVKLFLQDNRTLTMLPPSFFENMPVLHVLNLSCTSIQSLPPSISKLTFLQEFILRDCSLIVELPPEIGALISLKLFDMEGTEIMYLPQEIGKLKSMECLRVSLSLYADEYIERKGIGTIIPRKTISKLTRLKELSINVNPEAEWWEIEFLGAILPELRVLPDLETLKLYLPTVEVLQRFLQLHRSRIPIYATLSNFRLIVGRSEQPTCSLPPYFEEDFEKLEKCLIYMNGEGSLSDVAKLVRSARALLLRRHWTVENLSIFDLEDLKYCVLMECNEMQTLFDGLDLQINSGKQAALGSLEYLAIHFMKKLERIWMGPIGRDCLSCLRVLALHTCPELTTVFTTSMLDNLQSLTELTVEDCPKLKTIVSWDSDHCHLGPFFPNLRRISLLDLPELTTISWDMVFPEFDGLLVFNCPKLFTLSFLKAPPQYMKEIRGEIEWWDALYDKSSWINIFVELKRDGGLMDQLAEATNSLQHFRQLLKICPYPAKLKAEREPVKQLTFCVSVLCSSKETQEMSTQTTLNSNNDTSSVLTDCEASERQLKYAQNAFRRWESPDPFIGTPQDEDSDHDIKHPSHKVTSMNKKTSSSSIAHWIQQLTSRKKGPVLEVPPLESCDFKDPKHKVSSMKKKNSSSSIYQRIEKVKVSQEMELELEVPPPDDGYSWRKYGLEEVIYNKYPRGYYRCSYRTQGCEALKQVQRSDDDPTILEITYRGEHTCQRGLPTSDSSTATLSASTVTERSSELPDLAQTPEVLDSTISDPLMLPAFDIILSWGSTAEIKTFVFEADRKEIDQYLHAVDEIQSSINSAAASDNICKLRTTIQVAMSRLRHEFHNILKTKAKSKEHSSFLNPSSSTFQISMTDAASTNYEVDEDENYLNSSIMSLEVINDLQSIAMRMNSAGYIHDCMDVYIRERRSFIKGKLQWLNFQRLSKTSARRLEWEVLESMIKVWIKSANICFKYLFAVEKRLCEQIFQGFGDNTEYVCFVRTVEDYAVELFDTVEALSFIRLAPDRLFRILDLYESFSSLLPQISKLFHTQSAESFRSNVFTKILPKLAGAVDEVLSGFEKALLNQQSVVIFVSAIHPLSKYVMSYVCQLCDHKQTLMEFSLSQPPSSVGAGMNSEMVEFKGQNELSSHVIWIIMTLVSNLESQAKLCEDASAGSFFAMNNVNYIVQKIKEQPVLREVIGDGYFSKLIQKLDQAKAGYLRSALEKIREIGDY